MAKKIRIDFSKTEDRSSWNTRQIPAGIYKAEIVSVKETEAQDGTGMLVYGLRPTNNQFRTRLFPFYCKLQQNQLWKLRDLLTAAGESIPKKAVNLDPNKVVGRHVAIEVEDDVWEGKVRSQVQATFGVDLVDETDEDESLEDAAAEDAYTEPEDTEEFDEEDDEDFEDDEDDIDLEEDDLDGDEDEEDDWEDEDDDLEDEDEDDFDDEDDEEDLEEEEEEEEPAPKPRAKKPAAKKRVARKRK